MPNIVTCEMCVRWSPVVWISYTFKCGDHTRPKILGLLEKGEANASLSFSWWLLRLVFSNVRLFVHSGFFVYSTVHNLWMFLSRCLLFVLLLQLDLKPFGSSLPPPFFVLFLCSCLSKSFRTDTKLTRMTVIQGLMSKILQREYSCV